MPHDVHTGVCTFRQRIPTGHLRRSFGRQITDAIRRQGGEVLEALGSARRSLPDFGQVYGRLTREARETLPDFEEQLASLDRDTTAFLYDARLFADATEMVTTEFDVDECTITDEGFAMVGVYSRDRRVEIRQGDAFLGGAVFAADLVRGTCSVSARLVRLVCANGVVLPLRAEHGVQHYERSPLGGTHGSIEETVHAAFSGKVLQSSVRPLGPAAGWHITDPLASLAGFGVQLEDALAQEVLKTYVAAGDETVYGAVNALSQTARDTTDLRKRLEIETRVGKLLARLGALSEHLSGPLAAQLSQSDPVAG